jgi:formylglycine-generating enzyme required for sulfatase activity
MNARIAAAIGVVGGCCLVLTLAHGQGNAAKKYAVLVGVKEYQHQKLPTLRYSENDVVELGKVLDQAGYRVTVLCDSNGKKDARLAPDKANIDRLLHDVLYQQCKKGDTVIVAFAGHGVQFAKQKDAYFCPADARPFANATESLVSLNKVYEEFEQSHASMKVLLVDACRNEPDADRGTRAVDADNAPRPPKGVAALFSCSAGEVAFEHKQYQHGVFFYHLLQGLKGKAVDDEGEVTFESLAPYVRKRVSRDVPTLIGEGAQQSPNSKADLIGASPTLIARAAPAAPPAAPVVLEDALIREMKFVKVPKGTFWMSEDAKNAVKQVTINADFELAAYTVTQGQWQAVMNDNPSYYSRNGKVADVSEANLKRFPVESVSWDDVQKFVEKLNEREKGKGWRYRLPKEAEWEYACRNAATDKAECSFDFYFAKGGTNDLSSKEANFNGEYPAGNGVKGNYLGRPTMVGQYEPNKLGLYDMHGNVRQWCEDLYDTKGPGQVVRGGSWRSHGRFCRAAFRDGYAPSDRYDVLGFRLARVPSGL